MNSTMKKIFRFLLIICLIFIVNVLILVSCDNGYETQSPIDTEGITTDKDMTLVIPPDKTSQPETESHTHAFGKWTTVKEATCTEKGKKERNCTCGEKETQGIDLLDHEEVIDLSVEPTCTSTGLTEGIRCSRCNEVLKAQEVILKKEHAYESKICTVCNKLKPSEGLEYTLVDDSGYTVSKIGNCQDTEIVIPDTYLDKPVISIGARAFGECNTIISVIIPDSVISIDKYAFSNCSNLINVNIPDSVTNINEGAFYECTKLSSVTIPDSVVSIEDAAFYRCKSLTNIFIPHSVKTIGNSIFSYCNSLTNITISENNPFYYSVNNCIIEKEGKKLILGINNSIIPNDILSIEYGAFAGCKEISSINIPSGVKSIGENAFQYCTKLTDITISDSVESIGGAAFACCTSLKSIIIPDSVTSIGYGAFYECTELANVIIGNNVKSIGFQAFFGCIKLKSIIIPDSVTVLQSSVFEDCIELTDVVIGNGLTSIIQFSFLNCKKLTNLTIGNSVTLISDNAFNGCPNIKTVTLPLSIERIEHFAFVDLENIIYPGTKAQWDSVEKEGSWNLCLHYYDYIIHCTDGDIITHH